MIRKASDTDFYFLTQTLERLIKESKYERFFSTENLEDLVYLFLYSETEERVIFIIEDNHTPVGSVAFEASTTPFSPVRIARIAAVYIEPDYRGKGYMSEVYDALEKWGSSVGATYLNVSVSKDSAEPKRGYVKYETVYMKKVN